MSDAAAEKPDNPMITVVGGVEFNIEHLPAEAFDESDLKRLEKFQPLLGQRELVKVRQVRVSNMPRYANAVLFNDEAAAIEIYCAKEPGWADTLTPESVNAIADKGLEINLPFFGAWYARQAKLKKTQEPSSIAELSKKLTELEATLNESRSRNSSEKSPTTTG